MPSHGIKDRVAIIGMGCTRFVEHWDLGLDDLLVNAIPSAGTIVRDVRIGSCLREQPHQRKDASEGVPVVYLGGFYRISYQPANQ